ncbi:MAG TPA: carbon starvation CstA family protein [Pirellulales bacterium]|jgi:carbon starvation protein|nr:carbon starvation CstA family protein [Pirellulales bacterium]
MTLLPIVLVSAIVLTIAYVTYGRVLTRLLRLDPEATTPAVELRDDVDYEPIEPKFLLSQHFSAIAAAGPIIGPITAGILFGWVPALIWILVGAIFIGGVHDMTSLTASIRHKARSIAEVVRDHMSQRSYLMFLSFVWIALVYIVVAFTDVTAGSFAGDQVLSRRGSAPPAEIESSAETAETLAVDLAAQDKSETIVITGAGIATSSLLYLALPVIMGVLLRYTKLTLNWATVIFVPLVGVAIWAGQKIPFDLGALLNLTPAQTHKVWDIALLGYCLVAAMVPVWLLLQPRGHLGGFFLYVALGGGALGLMLGGEPIRYPEFRGWTAANGQNVFPFLFITIACGACSGFHSLIASGTTSKQLRRETDARPIGYGAMLLEAMVAIVSLCCVMVLAPDDPAVQQAKPDWLYSQGIGRFLESLGVDPALGVAFAMMAFTTFVYDTLDICTRLGRYIIQELTGIKGRFGSWLGTGLTAGVPVLFILQDTVDANGNAVPVWRTFWSLFGASNQLLAALTLLGVTVWLWRTRRAAWVWFVTGIPMAFMYTMSIWALVSMTWPKFFGTEGFVAPRDPVPWIGLVLLALAVLMLIEAVRVIVGARPRDPHQPQPIPATA